MTPIWHFGDPIEPLRALLARGGVLAVPTESSYALGADPRNRVGVETVYRIKERAADKALPVVVAERGQMADLGIDRDLPILEALSACWPGPLTVVLPLAAGTGTLAVRIPGHAGLRGLLAALGHGLTATSANRSGGEPIVEPEDLPALLAGEDAVIVDGGSLPGGAPSTLVAIDGGVPVVLRAGSFPVEKLRAQLERLSV
jgi:L-threonylcarbamoyladenylate synthase